MNPNDERHFGRLRKAVEHSRRKLEDFRKNRLNFIKQYVGTHYGAASDGSGAKNPTNLIELLVGIYTQTLAANTPAVMSTSPHEQFKRAAMKLQLYLNHLLDEIDYSTTSQELLSDAMFGLAVVKTGMTTAGQAEVFGFLHDVGQPFADRVSLDDWVHDVTATRYESVQFAGDRFRIPLEDAKEMQDWDKKQRAKLQGTEDIGIDENGDERAEAISKGTESYDEDYKKQVDLTELWLPRENLRVVMAKDQDKPLYVGDYEGPEHGPYRLLRLGYVPDNIMPLPPVATLLDLHDLANRIFRKMGRKADRQKTNIVTKTAYANEVTTLRDASDGDTLAVTDPDAWKELSTGGVDATSFALFLQVKDLFTYLGGNLDALGGLSPQSETASQDKLLATNASKRVAYYEQQFYRFTTSVIRDLAWYPWHSRFIKAPLVLRIPGTDVEIPMTYTAEDREGDLLDYNIQISPYSMQYDSPASRLSMIRAIWQQDVIPLAPLIAQQGGQPNAEAYMDMLAKYSNLDDVRKLIVWAQPALNMGEENGPVFPEMRQSPVTQRNYTRRNIPGSSRQGKDATMMRLLLGSGVQDSEGAAMSRPTG